VRFSIRVDAAEDQILRSNPNAVAVTKVRGFADEKAIHANAISASEILDARAVIVDDDLGVLARNQRVLDRQVAIEAAPYDRGAPR
jgi:hypothetical protein